LPSKLRACATPQLDAEVRRPAEAELYAAQQRAEARKAEIVAEAAARCRRHPDHR
jgi:hypothetical protein